VSVSAADSGAIGAGAAVPGDLVVLRCERMVHGGVCLARLQHGVGAYRVVVGAVDGPAAPEVGAGEHFEKHSLRLDQQRGCGRHRFKRAAGSRRSQRHEVDQDVERQVRDRNGAITDPHAVARGDGADLIGVQLEVLEDTAHGSLATMRDQHQHPLLRLREHHLVGRHSSLPPADLCNVDLKPTASAMSQRLMTVSKYE